MKVLSIDIETYSEADLNKTGVYRYADDPSFQILLFGYAVDGGDVRVIDLTAGETLPAEVLDEKMIEKVNPSHPDKLADRIAGALVDYAYSVQADPRIAVEVQIGHRLCHIIAETSVHIPATFVQDTASVPSANG